MIIVSTLSTLRARGLTVPFSCSFLTRTPSFLARSKTHENFGAASKPAGKPAPLLRGFTERNLDSKTAKTKPYAANRWANSNNSLGGVANALARIKAHLTSTPSKRASLESRGSKAGKRASVESEYAFLPWRPSPSATPLPGDQAKPTTTSKKTRPDGKINEESDSSSYTGSSYTGSSYTGSSSSYTESDGSSYTESDASMSRSGSKQSIAEHKSESKTAIANEKPKNPVQSKSTASVAAPVQTASSAGVVTPRQPAEAPPHSS